MQREIDSLKKNHDSLKQKIKFADFLLNFKYDVNEKKQIVESVLE